MIWLILISLFVVALILLMIHSKSVEDLRYELTEWIRIGIGDDIIRMPGHRPEYAAFLAAVNKMYKNRSLDDHQKVNHVLGMIEAECRVPRLKRFLRDIFWRLLWIEIQKCFKWVGF